MSRPEVSERRRRKESTPIGVGRKSSSSKLRLMFVLGKPAAPRMAYSPPVPVIASVAKQSITGYGGPTLARRLAPALAKAGTKRVERRTFRAGFGSSIGRTAGKPFKYLILLYLLGNGVTVAQQL